MSKLLKKGDIIELVTGHRVYADVPEHFVYSNRVGVFKMTHHDVIVGGVFAYLAGDYVVLRTKIDGGGYGHGPGNVYSDGYHVFCEKMDNPHLKVDFYQTGCFTAMIEDIATKGKAKQISLKKEWRRV